MITLTVTVLLILLVLVTWSACTRCDKCHGWCVDDWDCKDRQHRQKNKNRPDKP